MQTGPVICSFSGTMEAVACQFTVRFGLFATTGVSELVAIFQARSEVPQTALQRLLLELIQQSGYETRLDYESEVFVDGKVIVGGRIIGYFTLTNATGKRGNLVVVSMRELPAPLPLT
jgi:hypothetical protein